jgi:two-component system, chemotaxis family, CheB/CheR fusion protein
MKPLDGLRVLLVDDHDDTLEILGQVLTHQGAVVITVTRARAALEALDTIDVVVTDYKLPGEDGVWLLRQIRARGRATPVVALTGVVAEPNSGLALAGFSRVLLKPIDPWALSAAIVAVVRGGGLDAQYTGAPPR